MARRGNGPGRGGPANGPGWGGPARGIGHNNPPAGDFEDGNQAAVGEHSTRRSEDRARMLEVLFSIAMDNSQPEMLQIMAAERYLDFTEGPCKPMARVGSAKN
jgi:hypothetical protein